MAINWDDVKYGGKTTGPIQTDARDVMTKKQAKTETPIVPQTNNQSSIDWNRVWYVPAITRLKEEDIKEAAKRQKTITNKIEPVEVERTTPPLISPPIGMGDFRKAEAEMEQARKAAIGVSPAITDFVNRMQTQQSGITPANITNIRNKVETPPEELLRSPITQFGVGAYEGMNIAKSAAAMQGMSGQGEPLIARLARETQPYSSGWRTAGRLYGSGLENIALYSTVGKAAEGWSALDRISSPFLRNLAGQQLADTVIQTPSVIIGGVAEGKSVGEIAKDVGKQQAQDLAANLLFMGAETLLKTISQKLKSGKALTQAEVEAVQNTTKQIGGNPADSIDEQVKRIDDWYQSRRGLQADTTPTGDAIWKNKEFDQPVRVTGFAGERGGRKYVNIEGSNTAIPLDEIEFVPIGGNVEPPKVRIYGEAPRGEIPKGMMERGFSRNIRTDTAMPDDIRQVFDENPAVYKQITNNETLAKAQNIFNKGQAEAELDFFKSIGSKEFRPEDVPLAKLLAKQASEQGDITKARQILSVTAEKLTEAGQFSQAAKILRESDPETFLMTIDRQIRKLNEQGLKQYGKKWTNIDLLPEEIAAIQNIPRGNQQAYEEVWEQIGQRIAKELPSTGMEKFDAWRRMAMLLNPKTHIRNIGGNVIMMGMRKSSDTLAAVLEKVFVPAGKRTKSFGWSLNKNIASKVDETWNAVKKDILGESRWEIDNLKALGREKRIFKNPALQWLNEVSLKTLNVEDNIFTERAFRDALGQYMQANKLTEVTDAAIDYARRRALEATFKQANMLSDFLNKAKQTPGIGKLVEGAVPFTKTPANIAARAVEYSPLGIIKAIHGKLTGKTAAQIIEDLSKGLTGSAITALGYYLGATGWAKVERSRSEKAEGLMQEMGDQTNSIITPYGSYTFDWAQPFSVPLAMGIAAAEALKNRKDGDTIAQAVWDGIMAGGDTIFNLTMLQNIKQLFSGGSISERLAWIPVSYLEQALPSLFGQIARTIDPVKRSTYDPNRLKQEWNRIKSRTPSLSQTLEPALNIWGEEQQQGGIIQQFINPGYWKEKSSDPVTNEVARLYGEFKDTDMLPKVAPKSFTDKGVEYRLTPKQITDFQRRMGQENYNKIARLISSAEYQRMTDEEKAKKIKKIVNDNYENIKNDIIKSSTIKGK